MKCIRCGLEFEQKESEELCLECDSLVEQALELIEKDPKVLTYFEEMEKAQEKAEARLDFIYNSKDQSKFLKSVGKGIKKVYQFNFLELGIDAAKKIFSKEKIQHKTEQELLLEEIVELKKIIEIDPIEFVIYKYLMKNDEETESQQGNRNFIMDVIDNVVINKYLQLDEKKKLKIAVAFIAVVSLLSLLVIFL